MTTTTEYKTVGPGFLGLLTITFVVLKATGYLNWSWWWVFAPIWLPFAVVLAIVLVGLGVLGLLELLDRHRARQRRKQARK